MELSANIIDWAYRRLEDHPRLDKPFYVGTSLFSSEYMDTIAKMSAYDRETIHFYVQRFAPLVKSVRDEMMQHGIVDKSLDDAFNKIINTDTILFIGGRIGELAKGLDN